MHLAIAISRCSLPDYNAVLFAGCPAGFTTYGKLATKCTSTLPCTTLPCTDAASFLFSTLFSNTTLAQLLLSAVVTVLRRLFGAGTDYSSKL